MAERYHIPEFFASIRFCCQNKSATTCSKHVVVKNKGGDIDVGRRPALKETLLKLVEQGMKRTEKPSFVKRDFSLYPWSIRIH